jgi:hypothetical protein
LVSIALPAAIAQYSHLIVAATEQGEAQPATARTAAKTAKHRRWQFWRKPQEAATTSSSTTSTAQMPVALPVGILTAQNASTGASQPPAELPERAPASAPTLRVVDGASDADLATQLGVTRQAVAGMRKRGTLERNIAKRLPSLTPVHVNGNTNGHNA